MGILSRADQAKQLKMYDVPVMLQVAAKSADDAVDWVRVLRDAQGLAYNVFGFTTTGPVKLSENQ